MADVMPALTVWQPWATLIAEGVKPHEFRGYAAPKAYRGKRLAIHAGARPMQRRELQDLILRLRDPKGAWSTGLTEAALLLLERMLTSPGLAPRSVIVCVATLGVPVRATELIDPWHGDSDRVDHQAYGWPLTDIERLDPPVPAKGAQGIWYWKREAIGD